ncbi:NrfD/PsrC family molybdoenzyme membrane anchor subunit [Desulfitobacterium sp.]|uniref:NrfD/PsrC family molybdoenzyme membrane anchor subunit n=1 Tax=Desulfitobacterium sp. TaxID=49981 RepID=UPI002B1F7E8E|nr:NrfD/PsrC family molybdoenzyme membrane anchor subunit [Desulfitobacterium sp.]MEA4902765.1 NrfD/PsrC family molybdoenzyme membrane anchor subunit [Desulfitobacterium sp.]
MDVTWGIGAEEIAWGGMIAIYLFLAGVAGGAFLTASLTDLFNKNQYSKVIRSGAYIAPLTIIFGLLLLVVDLGKPFSFWKLLLYVNFKSVMSIGVFIISVFSALSVVYGFLVWQKSTAERKLRQTSANAQVAATTSSKGLQALRKPVAAVGVLFSIGTATYTGFLLSAITTNNFWHTAFLGLESIPFLPILFLVSATSTGLAATLIGAVKCCDLTPYKKIDMVLIILEIILISILYLTADPIFFTGSMATLFWLGVVTVGLIVPLFLSIYGVSKHKNIVLPVCGMVVIGGLCLRYFVVFTGQLF